MAAAVTQQNQAVAALHHLVWVAADHRQMHGQHIGMIAVQNLAGVQAERTEEDRGQYKKQ